MFTKDVLLVITAMIWGFNFVVQSVAMNDMGPMFFSFIRFVIASLTMLLIIFIRSKKHRKNNKDFIKYGIITGICLFIASVSQQIGLVHTSPGKAGFISALYILFVPIISIFKGKRSSYRLWISVVVALFGLYLLTFKGDTSIESSDLLILFSSFMYAIHILLIDKFAPNTDPYKYNCVQFIVVAILSLIASFVFKERMDFNSAVNILPLILYAGAVSTGIAYTTQTLGQINNDPTVASLIMSLESVFAALSSYIFLNQVLSKRELFGSALIFAAIIFVQLPFGNKKNN